MMNLPVHICLCAGSLALLLTGCADGDHADIVGADTTSLNGPLFREVPAEHSNVRFTNTITESVEHNYFNYQYIYNGGGVAIGDINNDGLPDIYLTGNMVPDKLYLNKGQLQFEDITSVAFDTVFDTWHNGVTMADVDGDGFLDIYVCRSGWQNDPEQTSNLFYHNNGDLTFTEMAGELGIADTTHSTQAAFFDMDTDGDLDLFVMNTPNHHRRGLSNVEAIERVMERKAPTDRLYRNDGGNFVDVSYDSGIHNYAYSLGSCIADLNMDGKPDIYEANDYDAPDLMYMNMNGTFFREELQARTRHISNFGMGCDVADYNNDGLPDIMVLDMVSEDHERSKMNMGSMAPERFWKLVRVGYHYQYMLNTLQLNNGNNTFSEVAQLAGVARTDWSWAPLFADFDNDGWKDLVITNGYKRDMRNNDFVSKFQGYLDTAGDRTLSGILDLVPSTKIHNYLFRNNGDLTFTNVSKEWGFNRAVNSNGIAYGDLDNDGDLDLVINNMDEMASIQENLINTVTGRHYLRVHLAGENGRTAIGAKAHLWKDGAVQYQELQSTRGYQSSVEPLLHFGAGPTTIFDSLIITWPSGSSTVLKEVAADRVLTLVEDAFAKVRTRSAPAPTLFQREQIAGLQVMHVEDPYNDLEREVLLPHKYSELGPTLAVADVNGDGTDDLFMGGAEGSAPVLLLQSLKGAFEPVAHQPWSAHLTQEQLGGHFLDADGDGDQDLLVLAGGNQHDVRGDHFIQRLYFNDGSGRFVEGTTALPPMQTSAFRAASADIDGDGDVDLFIGGRITPGHYPFPPRSYLLANNGKGRFADITEQQDSLLTGPGMVTDAVFADLNKDGLPELILSGEWMPITIFQNQGGTYKNATAQYGLTSTAGWWYSLAVGDLDADGDLDIAAGNLGWNSKFQGTPEHPVHVYWGDMDGNGRSDIVLAKEKSGKLLPVRGRECSSQQCPRILDRFSTYEEFAHASLEQIYGSEQLSKALHLKATCMRSAVFINENGVMQQHELPNIAQVAPINAIRIMDVDQDGQQDLICVGNNWGAEVETARYDAGTGLVLLGSGKGTFRPLTPLESGFFAWNNAKDLTLWRSAPNGRLMIAVANNNGPLEIFGAAERPVTLFSVK